MKYRHLKIGNSCRHFTSIASMVYAWVRHTGAYCEKVLLSGSRVLRKLMKSNNWNGTLWIAVSIEYLTYSTCSTRKLFDDIPSYRNHHESHVNAIFTNNIRAWVEALMRVQCGLDIFFYLGPEFAPPHHTTYPKFLQQSKRPKYSRRFAVSACTIFWWYFLSS